MANATTSDCWFGLIYVSIFNIYICIYKNNNLLVLAWINYYEVKWHIIYKYKFASCLLNWHTRTYIKAMSWWWNSSKYFLLVNFHYFYKLNFDELSHTILPVRVYARLDVTGFEGTLFIEMEIIFTSFWSGYLNEIKISILERIRLIPLCGSHLKTYQVSCKNFLILILSYPLN